MSDDFDREAEKEKLREQLEAEEESRRATQHMSELLLKGATMTNKHCDECGDPVFRHEGQEFCPTCQRPVGDDAEATEEAAPEPTDEADAAADADGAGSVEVETVENGDAAPETSHARDATDETPEPSTAQTTDRDAEGVPDPALAATGHGDGDLDEARDALVRTVTGLARRAEATDDLGRTRDLLAATREAAEALSAVRDAGR